VLHRSLIRSLLVIGTLAALERAALAQDCSTLPNPLYLQVGDTQEPLMKQLGRRLRENAAFPVTIIYKTSGSCTNIDAIYNGTKLTTNPSYVPSIAEDPAWDPSMPSPTCVIDPAGATIDVANSALFIDACTQAPMPAGLAAFTGPVQPYLFIVPEASTQDAITAEEAYFVFGFGAAGMAEPWTDESFYFIRTTTKSTLLSIAANIGEVLNAVATSVEPERTIGIMGAEIYDGNRDVVNALAFRAFGQRYAYFPDSTRSSFDKKNVRDGHYTIWSPTVYIAPVDAQGQPVNPRAKYVIDMILSKAVTPEPNFEPLDILVSGVKLVPDCAMRVQRQTEGGPLSLYDPPEPCGCYFDAQLGTPAESCTTCSSSADCGAGVCRHGYCEAK
jgi:hypothetical protein